jgi:hypothetical protein
MQNRNHQKYQQNRPGYGHYESTMHRDVHKNRDQVPQQRQKTWSHSSRPSKSFRDRCKQREATLHNDLAAAKARLASVVAEESYEAWLARGSLHNVIKRPKTDTVSDSVNEALSMNKSQTVSAYIVDDGLPTGTSTPSQSSSKHEPPAQKDKPPETFIRYLSNYLDLRGAQGLHIRMGDGTIISTAPPPSSAMTVESDSESSSNRSGGQFTVHSDSVAWWCWGWGYTYLGGFQGTPL